MIQLPHNLSCSAHLILILGMHRSGTSALTSALAELGFELGEHLLPPAPDNPLGFFENTKIVAAQDELLESLGVPWYDPRPLPGDWLARPAARIAADRIRSELLAMGARSSLLAVKDPRSCRLLPLWIDVAKSLGFPLSPIIMTRHPAEVGRSLAAREGLGADLGALLWLEYQLAAVSHSCASEAALIDYRDLLAQPERCIARVLSSLGIDVEVNGLGSIDPQMRHHQSSIDAAEATPIGRLASALYELLVVSWPLSTTDAQGTLARIRGEFALLRDGYMLGMREFAHGDSGPSGVFSARLAGLDGAHTRPQVSATLRARPDDESEKLSRIAAVCAELAAEALVARSATPRAEEIPVRLYFRRAEDGYSEEAAVDGLCRSHVGRALASFEFDRNTGVDWVRVDLGHLPGIFTIHSVVIDSAPVNELPAHVAACNELQLDVRDPGKVRIGAAGNDPWFELRLPAGSLPEQGGPCRIEVEFVQERAAGLLADAILDRIAQGSPAVDARIERAAHALQAQLDQRMQQQVAHTLDLVDQSVSRQSAHAEVEFEALREAFERVRQGAGEVLARIEQLEHKQATVLGTRIEELAGMLEASGSESEARSSQLSSRQQSLETRLAELANTLDNMPLALEQMLDRRSLWARIFSRRKGRNGP